MNLRRLVALVSCLALAAVVTVSTASASKKVHKSNNITVWLMTDAQTGWPNVVASANTAFHSDTGGTATVVYKTWGAYLQDFDAAIGSGHGIPDVIEFGNTQIAKYVATTPAGSILSPITTSDFANSSKWLSGLALPGMYKGKEYAVPYYAGSRVATYIPADYTKAKIKKLPTNLAAFQADGAKLIKKFKSTKGFSGVYTAGTDWYVAMGFVFDYNGGIAKFSGGKWHGLLTSKGSLAGLKAYKSFFLADSRASKTGNEDNPSPYAVMAAGKAATILGPGWFGCCVGKYVGKTKQFVIPSHKNGKGMPGFLGGSVLGIPVGGAAGNIPAATDWVKNFVSTSSENAIEATGNIPNAKNLLNPAKVNEKAAANSWFVPVSANWANVENGNVLRTMLAQILTNKLSIKQAAANADDNIEYTLNH